MSTRFWKSFNTNARPCMRIVRSYSVAVCSNGHFFTNKLFIPQRRQENVQCRHFSVQNAIETVVKTQTGIFKSISESTPVGYSQKFLLTLHDMTGLPWWATIVLSTILVRTCVTAPLAIYQNYILAKVENLNLEMPEIVNELKREMAVAIKKFNWDEKTAKFHYKRSLKKQWNLLIVRDNCHPVKAGLLLWVQIPVWVCFSVSLRNLVYMLPVSDTQAHATFLELAAEGFAWIPSLVHADSSLILPLALGVVNLTIIELQTLSKVRVPTRMQRYFTNIFRGVSVLMVPIAACVPSCLALYWTTSSVYGLVQNLVLMSPRVKRACHIPKTPTELEQPYRHVLEGVKYKFNLSNVNKSTSE